jgi:hypothetical protein
MLTPDPSNLVDGLPPLTRADVETMCEELATQVRLFCAVRVECKMLANNSPVIEV